MPPTFVRPGQVVWRLTGLRLRGVMLRLIRTSADIDTSLGTCPPGGYTVPEPYEVSERPHYVLISESPFLASFPDGLARWITTGTGSPGAMCGACTCTSTC